MSSIRVEPGSTVEYVGPFGTVWVELDEGGRRVTVTAPAGWGQTTIPGDGELQVTIAPRMRLAAKPFEYADGLIDPAEVSNAPADRLSRGLFRSTGPSD